MSAAGMSIEITKPFLLPKDVVSAPVASLPEDDRRRLGADEEDFVLTRVHGRSSSKVIDAPTAKLLERFREATTIIDAILSFTEETGGDPEETLEAAYPVLDRLIRARFLVEEGSTEAAPFKASLQPGDDWDGLTLAGAVQVLEDSELHRAHTPDGQPVALKIARAEAAEQLTSAMRREATILSHLDGGGVPRLVKAGSWNGRPYVATAWCGGVRGDRFSARLRALPGVEGRRRLLDLCCTVAGAYASLHGQDVIHGDVHPGNLVIDNERSVTIIDFGYGRLTTSDDEHISRARRVGVGYFFEPEYARVRSADAAPLPLATFVGEQHVLAHLLYRLVTGHSFAEFSADQRAGMTQLADSEPWPFARWGVAPWPGLERVLAKALSVDPNQRFESVAHLAAALREVEVPEPTAPEPLRARAVTSPFSDRLLDDYLHRFDPSCALFESELPEIPRCSIYFGSGGIAYFLYRLACIREDARLLTWAKLWIEKTIADVEPAGQHAFYIPGGTIPYDVLGPIALYHTMSGLRAVQTLIAKAQGDVLGQIDGVNTFAAAVRTPWENIDLTLGRSGVLLGCTLLHEALPGQDTLPTLGDAVMADIWAAIDAKPEIERDKTLGFTGIAHGWAGIMYAVMAWCRAANRSVPGSLTDRLNQLADLAEPYGRGVRWQRMVHPPEMRGAGDYWPSWCNGTGGMIFLWTLAHQTFGEPRYLELAERAAWHVIEQPEPVNQICCGRPGQAFGILNLYKHTGESSWLEFAKQMTADSLERTPPLARRENLPSFYYSLFKGPMGLALLSADMTAAPDRASMPLFETEGWTGGQPRDVA